MYDDEWLYYCSDPSPIKGVPPPGPKDGDRFFIIWNPDSEKPPRRRFKTRELAESVAADMAKKFHQEFFVCEAVVGLKVNVVLKTILSTPE